MINKQGLPESRVAIQPDLISYTVFAPGINISGLDPPYSYTGVGFGEEGGEE